MYLNCNESVHDSISLQAMNRVWPDSKPQDDIIHITPLNCNTLNIYVVLA